MEIYMMTYQFLGDTNTYSYPLNADLTVAQDFYNQFKAQTNVVWAKFGSFTMNVIDSFTNPNPQPPVQPQ